MWGELEIIRSLRAYEHVAKYASAYEFGNALHLYSVDDGSADSSAATGIFTPRLGVGREMPSFFIL